MNEVYTCTEITEENGTYTIKAQDQNNCLHIFQATGNHLIQIENLFISASELKINDKFVGIAQIVK